MIVRPARVFRLVAAILIGAVPLLASCGPLVGAATCFPLPTDPSGRPDPGPEGWADLHVALDWLPDDLGGTPVATRAQVGDAYLRAWFQWNLALRHCTSDGLDRSFGGPALAGVTADVAGAASAGKRIAQADTRHRLQLRSVSPDGAVVRLIDEAAWIVRVERDRFGIEKSARETANRYTVELVQASGQWRVSTLDLVAMTDLGPDRPLPPLETPAGFVGVTSKALVLDRQPYRVAGYNYFPEGSPWLAFWSVYDTAAIERDLAIVRGQGLDAVRILIPYAQFGGATPNQTYLDRLADFLSRARAHQLRVVVSLFDFHTDASVLLWASADRQLEAILRRFTDDSTVLAWDLRNEPNIFYPKDVQLTIDAWLTHLARVAREADPHHPLTIGWFTPEAALRLAGLVDLVSYHYYDPVSGFGARYAALRRAVPDKPILLSEFGRTTFNPLTFLGVYDEADQARYYQTVIGTIAASDSSGYLAWTLHDFPSYPPSSLWPQPWQLEVERHFGVLRWDGSPKPAIRSVRGLSTLRR